MGALSLVEPRAEAPDPKPTSYRFWHKYRLEQLGLIRKRIDTVMDDMTRQFSLFDEPAPAPPARPQLAVTTAPLARSGDGRSPQNDLGAVLSPSQVNKYLNCSAAWWFRYGAKLPDPASGAMVRGRVVHKMAETYFRARLAGERMEADDFGDLFQVAWDEAAADAVFADAADHDEHYRVAGVLTRLYLTEVAPGIEPAAVELAVSGSINGVPVRGFVDLVDTSGRIIDLKTAKAAPSGISSDYAFQLATYRQLLPGASGEARLTTLVATKVPKAVTLDYTVSAADQLMTLHLYPHVREGIREGLYFPNRCSNLCSRKYCNFADACEKEFGGKVE